MTRAQNEDQECNILIFHGLSCNKLIRYMQRCLAHITHARNVLQSWQLLGHWLENPECPQNPCFPWTAHEYPTQAPVSVRSEHPYTVDSIPQQNTKGTTLNTFRAIIPLLQNPVPNIDLPEWARVVWLLEKWLWHPPCNCGLNQGGVVIKNPCLNWARSPGSGFLFY